MNWVYSHLSVTCGSGDRSISNSGQFLITLWVTGANANTCQGLLCKAVTAQVSKGLLTPSTTWDRRVGPGSREVAFSTFVSEWINPSGPAKLTWGQLWFLSICDTVSYGPTSSWDPLISTLPSASSVLGLSKLIMSVSASAAHFGHLCSPD